MKSILNANITLSWLDMYIYNCFLCVIKIIAFLLHSEASWYASVNPGFFKQTLYDMFFYV